MTNQLELTLAGAKGAKSEPPVSHVPAFLSPRQQALLMAEAADYPFESPEIKVYGKWHPIPRQQVWFADEGCAYRYSSLLISPKPWPHYLMRLKQALEGHCGTGFNGCLVNHYRGGEDAMGFHADDEPELVEDALIAIVCLGATRPLLMRRRLDGLRCRVLLQSGDLLLMHPPMQSTWEHAIPRSQKKLPPRISFTFRNLKPYFHGR
ncbi:alpha-ketoglutarate-dependent dioxygenase AlkB family protein [Shewanella litorisediminis]|uniref:Alpha-ketoglutarate-dependent dioxygenase AlkB n=1 Tax=Shewanella litorisediminis TaxID=1173586 RepID=A0ABX7G0M5_9GAMM|nr:alpha-ketoglutarate-dependent dioxygenase AlkB [Shewanella litorisediminis]MCL2918112.1 alpha-ketoglutarate-dependent dioxygenase AlkB [Shewanella litorisediminis]QRH00830.1 alpha-ketoglutarate-dependent dioxygenase AlkB [Shewanella litorisediminis]